MTTEVLQLRNFLTGIFLGLMVVACGPPPIEDLLIHRGAQKIERHSFSESGSRQTSFYMQIEYPQLAVSDADRNQLEERGWTRCSGPPTGWDSYVDASKGASSAQTVFQNASYWAKGSALLTIVMRYYGGVTAAGGRLKTPGNADQLVILIVDQDPAANKELNLNCNR